jgi:antitoxin component YwqK of YwqJK toxin-antitoxin module
MEHWSREGAIRFNGANCTAAAAAAILLAMTKPPRKTRIDRHKDGSIRARGGMRGGKLDGRWVWFRKDGTKLRSGAFVMGERTGEWTTYDAKGKPYKVTRF